MPLDNNIDPAPPRSALSGLQSGFVQWLQKNLEWAKHHINDINAAITAPVSLNDIAQIAASTILGNDGAAPAVPAALTLDQIISMLDTKFPKMRAKYASGSVQSSQMTQVTWDVIDFDTHNFFVNKTTFQPNIAGYYSVSASLQYFSVSSGDIECHIRKYNGSAQLLRDVYCANTSLYNPNLTDIVHLNGVDEYVVIYAYQTTGAAQNLAGATEANYVSIARLF